MHVNIEFKARAKDPAQLEAILQQHHPRFAGEDRQVDTYFVVPHGRLKLREGNIENALIHYHRANTADAKQSDVILYQVAPQSSLKAALTAALGVKVVVDKRRRIYFIDNIKFHFDVVEGLGTFVEVEAIDTDGSKGTALLQAQCAEWQARFALQAEDYLADSYSDLLLAKKSSTPDPVAGTAQA